jgi:GNAT superfamily N-acetyltransferase
MSRPKPGGVPTPKPDATGVELPDGTRVVIRHLERDDRRIVARLFDGLGERSRRERFHGPKPRLTKLDVDVITAVDHVNREAIVAFDPTSCRPLGLAELVRGSGDGRSGEVAFAVVDDWQGRGLGKLLAHALGLRARALRMDRLVAYVSVSNANALSLVRRLGNVVGSQLADGAYELVVELD